MRHTGSSPFVASASGMKRFAIFDARERKWLRSVHSRPGLRRSASGMAQHVRSNSASWYGISPAAIAASRSVSSSVCAASAAVSAAMRAGSSST